MFWDDLVERWRRGSPANGPRLLRGAGGHVAVLPTPHRRRRSRFLLLLLVAALLAVGALLVASDRVASASGEPSATPAMGAWVGA
jgi:hypothetical protein